MNLYKISSAVLGCWGDDWVVGCSLYEAVEIWQKRHNTQDEPEMIECIGRVLQKKTALDKPTS